MRALLETLVVILLFIPVALLVIFDAPGIGLLLAIVLVAIVVYTRAERMSALRKTQGMLQQSKDAGYKKAA